MGSIREMPYEASDATSEGCKRKSKKDTNGNRDQNYRYGIDQWAR
jgi:hypothetical protein